MKQETIRKRIAVFKRTRRNHDNRRLFFFITPSSLPPPSPSLPSPLLIFEWQSWWYSRPPKPLSPSLSFSLSSLHPSPGLSGQWVSIRAWPSRRLATSILVLAKQLWPGLQRKWIPASTLHTVLPFSRPTGSCHGKQLSLDASWQPDSIANALSPHPRAFSRQIASSTLESNLLPTIGFYQRNRRLPLFLWTMLWE